MLLIPVKIHTYLRHDRQRIHRRTKLNTCACREVGKGTNVWLTILITGTIKMFVSVILIFRRAEQHCKRKNKFHLSHFISPNATWINEFRAPLRNIIHIFNETSERKWDLDSVLWEDQKTSHGG